MLLPGAVGHKFFGQPDYVSWGQWGMVFAYFYALAWEAFTPWLARKFFPSWDHPYGDFPDFMAYFLGAAIPLFVLSRL